MIELLNIDCMEYMHTVPDKHFDLAIVDPPYGHGNWNYGKGDTRKYGEYRKDYKKYINTKPSVDYFTELIRVSKNQIIWGSNHLCGLFDAEGPGWIVWEKEANGNYSDCELAYTSFDCALKRYRYRWNGMLQGEGIKKHHENRIHPSQKPVKLYDWLLSTYAEKGQRILDTHLGSGSSAIAAHYFGCDFVGCEIDPDYYKATKQRFEIETAQVAMF